MSLPPYAMNVTSFPEMYERWLVEPLFRPWAEVTIERAQLRAGDRVLDIACGTGIVARLARGRLGPSAKIVGVDMSPGMLAVAQRVDPTIEWREGNASTLPTKEGEAFDVVLCQQGLQFFPDKPGAVREIRRVLAPGGRVVISCWCPIDEVPMFKSLQAVAERHVGPITDHRHSFGDPAALERLLFEGGLHDVRVERLSGPVRFTEGATFVRMNTMAVVGMSATGKSLDDTGRAKLVDAIVADSAGVLPPFADGAALTFEISTNVATARS
jgi:ubiquinone/menaquinone biosynthesis C-methylase UbiE